MKTVDRHAFEMFRMYRELSPNDQRLAREFVVAMHRDSTAAPGNADFNSTIRGELCAVLDVLTDDVDREIASVNRAARPAGAR